MKEMLTVSDLLALDGAAGWLNGHSGFTTAVRLAEAVAYTIDRGWPIRRAAFIAAAAADLARLGPLPFTNPKLEDDIAGLADVAEDASATPSGSTELWTTAMEWAEYYVK